MITRKCQKCGNEFSEGLQCPSCGTFVDLLSDDNTTICPECKTKVIKGFMFCTNCHKKLIEEEEIAIPEKFDFNSLSAEPSEDVLSDEEEKDIKEEDTVIEETIKEEAKVEEKEVKKENDVTEEPVINIVSKTSQNQTVDFEEELKDYAPLDETLDENVKANLEKKMFCTNCGNKIGDGEMFCTNCGNKI